ncbi:MAG TPA: RNA 2',3'-cyclic phosphodiesterase [Tepidisphaeraceae bacterium]|jgi:2'-5' RNA ligase
MRLFIAIELPLQVIEHLDKLCRALRSDAELVDSVLRFVALESAHLTLKFLGEVDDARLPEVKTALSTVKIKPLRLSAVEMLYLPKKGPVHVIGVRVGGEVDRLNLLHEQIERSCESIQPKREDRVFLPHITLARWRPGPSSSRLSGIRAKTLSHLFPGPAFEARGFRLIQSILGADGAKHTVLETFSTNPNIS